ncbi:MAG: class I SAM-dependent methyltransferase [Planctomycetales bacterium]|nr:class I SAM-dependent methyltransferase [Planctomycetales bacterium]
MISDLLRFPRFYRYPYYHWGKAFSSLLSEADVADDATIIDAPCGDGVVTFWLAKNGFRNSFVLCDIAERDVNRARKLKDWPALRNVEVKVTLADIHDLKVTCERTRDVWFLINSLFLLPEIDRLFEKMRPRVEHVIGLFPDISSRNYRCYKKRHPTMNANEMDRNEVSAFFNRHGYETKKTLDASFIPHHCIQPMRLQQIARYGLNPFGNLVSKKDPCYWVGLFSRID